MDVKVDVLLDDCLVGTLAETADHRVSFAYSDAWLEDGSAITDCQKTLPGGLEGRSPPNVIRIRRHVRRMRKPCCARFPCAVSRPGVPQGREGNSVQLSEKDAVGGLFRHTEMALPSAPSPCPWSQRYLSLPRAHCMACGVSLRTVCPMNGADCSWIEC